MADLETRLRSSTGRCSRPFPRLTRGTTRHRSGPAPVACSIIRSCRCDGVGASARVPHPHHEADRAALGSDRAQVFAAPGRPHKSTGLARPILDLRIDLGDMDRMDRVGPIAFPARRDDDTMSRLGRTGRWHLAIFVEIPRLPGPIRRISRVAYTSVRIFRESCSVRIMKTTALV
jgi:hypothetical protein